ncbi:MAG: hypothetical protein U0169_20265 [Polyangiaceae bacterium]
MKDIHSREFDVRPADLARLVVRSWSGAADDPFPRDVIATWRKNPAGVADGALVPGVTLLGHAGLAFRFERWDGRSFALASVHPAFRGRHAFHLVETTNGTRLVHELELELTGASRVVWPVVLRPLHAWAIEALFDRLEIALRDGRVPDRTDRPLPILHGLVLRAMGRVRPTSLPSPDDGRLHALA